MRRCENILLGDLFIMCQIAPLRVIPYRSERAKSDELVIAERAALLRAKFRAKNASFLPLLRNPLLMARSNLSLAKFDRER